VDFAFDADQQLLRTSARAFLEQHCPPSLVRGLFEDPRGENESLWKDIAQLGWLGLPLAEEHGGSGLGMVETAIVLEELGRAAFPGPYLSTLLAAHAIAEAGTPEQREQWLPAIAAGDVRASVALLDADLDWDPRATAARAERRAGGGWSLSGLKRIVPWGHVANVLVVPARIAERRGAPRADGSTDGLSLFLVDMGAPGLKLSPLVPIDLSARWSSLRMESVPVTPNQVLGELGEAGPLMEALLRWGAVAAAAEMLGAARRCLEMSVEYAKVREQFGQPIGAFQAIRHACAEMLMEVENAHAATYYAAWALAARAEDHEVAASVAKAYVGDASRKVCGSAIQVHGGIGFTWEYDLHLYFKRAKGLEPLYGDADHHRELITRRLAR
jgi:alkylation response protein AidB-like acyl-CoA dehydrogenase